MPVERCSNHQAPVTTSTVTSTAAIPSNRYVCQELRLPIPLRAKRSESPGIAFTMPG